MNNTSCPTKEELLERLLANAELDFKCCGHAQIQ